jgi:hypothetical protein
MNLSKGTGIRIITENKNLFSEIIKDSGHSITIRLSEKHTANDFTSDLMEIVPADKKESLRSLSQYYSAKINGFLVNEITGEKRHFLSGIATVD